jgi:hypothetical protein
LAAWAYANDDDEAIEALRIYVLMRFAEGDGLLGSEAIKELSAKTADSLLIPLVDLALGLA